MTASDPPATLRDAASTDNRPLDGIKPARNFTKFVEYDFSKITDTKGGFLTEEDDRFNKALHVRDEKAEQKPAHMTQKEWERQQLLKNLHRDRAGIFEPGLSVLDERTQQKTCRECGSLEIDWKWEEAFRCCVCHACKDKFPDKYSLLTKTEAREDYLLTNRKYLPLRCTGLRQGLPLSVLADYGTKLQPSFKMRSSSHILSARTRTNQRGIT